MAEIKNKADDLIEHAGDYFETYYQLGKLKLTQKSSDAGSAVIAGVLMAVLGFFFVLFVSMGLAWLIGDALDSVMAGYFIVAGVYLIMIVIIILMRKRIITPYFRNMIVRKML